MSSPRDRDGADDGSDWQEPAHLSGDEPADPPNFADRRRQPRDGDHTAQGPGWQPPGWDLPAAEPDRERRSDPDRERRSEVDPSWAPPPSPTDAPERQRGGLFGSRPRTRDPEMERAFSYEGDQLGAQSWALQHGWTVSDGSGPQDAALIDLLASAPVRPGKDARPAGVLRGRAGAVELVAFDVVYPSGRQWVATHAITAAPLLGAVPVFRLSPARLWKHGTTGLVPLLSGDEAFDGRWQLLAAEDGPQVRRLAQDPAVHGLLLGTDDGDEFWTGAGHVAAVRPDGHRPQLIEHHARLLTAIVAALAAGV
ncbi:hypothetical protein [Blastococcus tunisiensis]|uniref:Uncharacterized protein n=1 Tax=Blastococcus tunisiensis TaxID=1798228 RepID=A0A1I2FQ39_9ACTN|nr:hypothetical protein [Blastococcus sp. DSM 46838]SFF06551.1 hypothetical protein SAMN05216574_108158 [Blastococcus sp. DSM 46838]